MAEIYHPVLSSKKIIRAVILAVIIGTVLLVCAILPAEYGIDPTGAGKALGFSRLHVTPGENGTVVRTSYPQLKLEKTGSDPSIPRPAEADAPPPEQQYEVREDSVQITVPAGKGLEYKVYMLKHGKLKYDWSAGSDLIYTDFHGEVNQAEPAKDTYYESYTLAYNNNMAGTFLAPFEGKHGWFFRNTSDKDVVVTIRLNGQYLM